MAKIAVDDVRTNQRIANVLMAYTNEQFLAPQILPVIATDKRTGEIPVLGTNHLRVYDSRRSTYDESQHRMAFEISSDLTYDIEDYDMDIYVPDKLIEEQEAPFNLRRDAQMSVLQAMMLEREVALATLMNDETIITNYTTLSGTSQWDDYVNSTPDTNVETARDTIHAAIGREPNSMYMSRAVFNKLKYHPLFLNRIAGIKVLDGQVLRQMIKDLWEVDNLYIGGGIKISTNEGAAETKTKVWNDDVVLFYKPATPSIWTPSFGYQFTLKNHNMKSSNRREPNADKGVLERLDWSYQDKVLDVNAAYLIKSAI
jgi:hypothetical protein